MKISILKIKSNRIYSGFTFRPVNYEEVFKELKKKKKILKENLDVFATFLVQGIFTCIRKGEFPEKLKTVDVTPAFKKGHRHDKSNYRPVSILPMLSNFYEKCLIKK